MRPWRLWRVDRLNRPGLVERVLIGTFGTRRAALERALQSGCVNVYRKVESHPSQVVLDKSQKSVAGSCVESFAGSKYGMSYYVTGPQNDSVTWHSLTELRALVKQEL